MPGARKFSAIPVAANGSDNYYSASGTRSSSYSYGSSGSAPRHSGSGTPAAEEWAGETDPTGSQSNNYEGIPPSMQYGYGYENSASQATNTDDCPDCEHFKVVQLNADPADPNNCGVIGYVYTYTIRKRHRTIKKMNCPKCPTKIVYIKDPPDKSGDVERRIKAADENIQFAKRQVERFKHDLQMAQEKKREAQEERFRLEEKKYGKGSGQRGVALSPSESSSVSPSSPASASPSGSSASTSKKNKKSASGSGSYSGSKSRSYGSSGSYNY